MSNYMGECQKCWWFKNNICYMHRNKVNDHSYCPDYINRRKENKANGTLDDWLNAKGLIW